MQWSSFTVKEKKAIIQSLAYIASSDGWMNASENQFIGLIILHMNEDPSSFTKTWMEQDDMVITLRDMSNEKKDILASLWVKCASRSTGSCAEGNIYLSSYPKEKEVIMAMAEDCNIKVCDHIYVEPS